MTRFLPLAGTHGWSGAPRGNWHQWPSPWLQFMEARGFVPYNRDEPFEWDTDLGGLFGRRKLAGWHAWGLSLRHYLLGPQHFSPPCGVDTRIVAHSHAAQLVAYAAQAGLRIERLVTIGSPVRRDMEPVWANARKNIGRWTHVYSDWTDRWQLLGQAFDGTFGIAREMPLADDNVRLPGVGHSGLLTRPEHFGLWEDMALLEDLRG